MDKKTTPSFSSSSVKPRSADNALPDGHPQPSGKTLDFLRNLRTVPQLPQGLQGIILG